MDMAAGKDGRSRARLGETRKRRRGRSRQTMLEVTAGASTARPAAQGASGRAGAAWVRERERASVSGMGQRQKPGLRLGLQAQCAAREGRFQGLQVSYSEGSTDGRPQVDGSAPTSAPS